MQHNLKKTDNQNQAKHITTTIPIFPLWMTL